MIIVDDKKYDLIENYREAFNEDEFRQYMKEQGSSPITEEDFEVDI